MSIWLLQDFFSECFPAAPRISQLGARLDEGPATILWRHKHHHDRICLACLPLHNWRNARVHLLQAVCNDALGNCPQTKDVQFHLSFQSLSAPVLINFLNEQSTMDCCLQAPSTGRHKGRRLSSREPAVPEQASMTGSHDSESSMSPHTFCCCWDGF